MLKEFQQYANTGHLSHIITLDFAIQDVLLVQNHYVLVKKTLTKLGKLNTTHEVCADKVKTYQALLEVEKSKIEGHLVVKNRRMKKYRKEAKVLAKKAMQLVDMAEVLAVTIMEF